MGYDINLIHPDTPSNNIGSITYNISPMYCKAFNGNWKDIVNYKLCKDAQPLINKAIDNMEANPEDYKKLEPENKWGTYEQALSFLKELEDECKDYPNMRINIF